ncbi:sugar-binding protein [Goodfellowiella coeruleoviolacea]|uniref:Ribose transport system substrate-binding protein n=1 Tax=Goodfellowiella coeruleoviolacea TaxID=334858 RepID=A0AAE3GBU4_9PSEU|nr:sugar-binding protein [Goodfellowiella coeruleoviolacea]MCP2164189.1 ribose transport system substrate-binding protein [Goodfellowiella coeruleoviolacea]
MRLSKALPVACALVTALVATACGSNSDTAGGQQQGSDKGSSQSQAEASELAKRLGIPEVKGASGDSYVFLPKSLDNPYWDDARKGMEEAAGRLGVTAEFLGPQTTDVGQQVQIFEAALARKPKGIAISPNDPNSVQATIAKAREQGINVIAWDSPVPNSQVQGYIGTDNTTAGRTFGENLIKEIGGKGKIAVIVGSLGAVNSQQRLTGLKDALATSPEVELVATEESNDSIATAASKTEAILSAHPDIAAIVGINAGDAPGAATALQQSNRCGKVKVAGFDAIQQSRDLMRTGCVQLLVSQRPYGMTAAALQMLVAMTANQPPATTELDTGVVAITQANLAEFEKTTA